MFYKEIVIISSSCKDEYRFFDLLIDGNPAEYDSNGKRTFFRMGNVGERAMMIKKSLPMNEQNPKETLDRFFKLLMLV